MPDSRRSEAQPIKKIIDQETGAHVGWLYEWNTGERVPRWKGKAHKDIAYD